jgi:hypothetical protein
LKAGSPIEIGIGQAIQILAREGFFVDTGERIWSEEAGRYQIVWMPTAVT